MAANAQSPTIQLAVGVAFRSRRSTRSGGTETRRNTGGRVNPSSVIIPVPRPMASGARPGAGSPVVNHSSTSAASTNWAMNPIATPIKLAASASSSRRISSTCSSNRRLAPRQRSIALASAWRSTKRRLESATAALAISTVTSAASPRKRLPRSSALRNAGRKLLMWESLMPSGRLSSAHLRYWPTSA